MMKGSALQSQTKTKNGSKINHFYDKNENIYIIADKWLTKGIIDVCLKLEALIKKGVKQVGQILIFNIKFDNQDNGFDATIKTSKPYQTKPIIYEVTFRADIARLTNWVDSHRNMLGGGMFGFRNQNGLEIFITEKPEECYAKIDIQGSSEKYIDKHLIEGITVIAHREVINDHAWIIKCMI